MILDSLPFFINPFDDESLAIKLNTVDCWLLISVNGYSANIYNNKSTN